MNTGIIGTGVIGKQHIKILNELGENIIAVCDTERVNDNTYINYNYYNDYIDMLNKEKLDIVHICTPHYLHCEMICECLKRNINVLCEKPLCIKKDDINKILEAEAKSNGSLGICFQHRYDESTLNLKEQLKDEKIIYACGELNWKRGKEYYSQGNWRGKWATEGGGVLINQAIHTIDTMIYLLGEPKEVTGFCDNISMKNIIEVEDTACINCYGKNNFMVVATNTADKDYETEIIIKTENNIYKLYQDRLEKNGVVTDSKPTTKKYCKKCYGTGHFALIKDFYDCVKNNRKFLIDGKEGAKSIKVVLGAYSSKGEKIKL